MSDRLKTSIVVTRQIPAHIRESYPVFVEFVQRYYEYLYSNQIHDLETIHDIDTALEQFLDFFKFELARYFPIHLVDDKKFIIKHLREFYLSRGSEKSFEFLFRALFNEDVTIKYPSENVLRASDGRWNQERIITIESKWGILPGSPSSFQAKHFGSIITVNVTRSQYIPPNDSNSKGRLRLYFAHNATPIQFDYNSEISFVNSSKKEFCIAKIVDTVSSISIEHSGRDWQIGQLVEIPGSEKTTIARVVEVNKERGISHLEILEFGFQSSNDFHTRFIVNPYRLKPSGISYDISHEYSSNVRNGFDYLLESKRQSIGYSCDSAAAILVDYYSHDYTFEYVTKNDSSFQVYNQRRSNVFGYEGPTIALYPTPPYWDDLYTNDEWSPSYFLEDYVSQNYSNLGEEGVIQSPAYVEVIDRLTDLRRYFSERYLISDDYVEAPNYNRQSHDPIKYTEEDYDDSALDEYWLANAIVRLDFAPEAKTIGYWSDARGQISNEVIRIQDNFYYQQFAYQISSSVNPRKYKDIVPIVHPAGRKLFTNYELTSEFNFGIAFDAETQRAFKLDLISSAVTESIIVKEVTKGLASHVSTISDGAKIRSLKYFTGDFTELGQNYIYPGEIVLTIAEVEPYICYYNDIANASAKFFTEDQNEYFFEQSPKYLDPKTSIIQTNSPKYITDQYTRTTFETEYAIGNNYFLEDYATDPVTHWLNNSYVIEPTYYFDSDYTEVTIIEYPEYFTSGMITVTIDDDHNIIYSEDYASTNSHNTTSFFGTETFIGSFEPAELSDTGNTNSTNTFEHALVYVDTMEEIDYGFSLLGDLNTVNVIQCNRIPGKVLDIRDVALPKCDDILYQDQGSIVLSDAELDSNEYLFMTDEINTLSSVEKYPSIF